MDFRGRAIDSWSNLQYSLRGQPPLSPPIWTLAQGPALIYVGRQTEFDSDFWHAESRMAIEANHSARFLLRAQEPDQGVEPMLFSGGTSSANDWNEVQVNLQR